jgi:transcriptional regulator with XRE-family HTH domain
LTDYIARRRGSDAEYSDGYQPGYEGFRTGLVLKILRLRGGMTQEEFAEKMHMNMKAVSRMENHAAAARLSTLMRAAGLLGKNLYISIE